MYVEAIALALLGSGSVLCCVAAVAVFRVESPAAELFALTAAITGVGGLAIGVGLGLRRTLLVLPAAISIGMVLPLAWLLFSFAYVGRKEFVVPHVVALVAAPIGIGLVATWVIFGDAVIPLVTLPARAEAGVLAAVVVTALNMVQRIALLYAGMLTLVGTGIILWTFNRYDYLDSRTGTALGAFGTAPWLSVLFGLQLSSISTVALGATTACGFILGTGAAVALVGPSALLNRVQAVSTVGPRTVIEELDTPVVVTDMDGRVVELNPAARQAVAPAASGVGRQIADIAGSQLSVLCETATIELETEDGRRLFAPTVSRLADQHDRHLGEAVVLRDVTAETTRRQRLEVLNRVLRHNLRNDVGVILARTELIATLNEKPEIQDSVDSILRTSRRLSALSEKAYAVETALTMDASGGFSTALRPLVADVFDTVDADREVDWRYDGPEDVVVDVPRMHLALALENLVENGVEHNDSERPAVSVDVSHDPDATYQLRLVVSDNGPGIPDDELVAIERGYEESLTHGSGIGLWIVHWLVTDIGGTLTFESQEPRGTVVTIALPTARRNPSVSTAAGGSADESWRKSNRTPQSQSGAVEDP